MMIRAAVSLVLAAGAAHAQNTLKAEDIPLSMVQLCAGKVQPGWTRERVQQEALKNIISWNNVPHDWEFANGDEEAEKKGDSYGRHQGKDWWYWGEDWQSRIATGKATMEPELGQEYEYEQNPRKNLLGVCDEARGAEMIGSERNNIEKLEACREACAFEFSTTDIVREKCSFFAYESGSKKCRLYKRCGWPYNTDENSDVDRDDENCYGHETRQDAVDAGCSWDTQNNDGDYTDAVWKTYTLQDIYPAGFRAFSLREFNEPPLCIHVPNSSDKKVEVMIETDMNDSRICLTDGRDMGIFNNDVGNVKTCDNGQLYSCFTAATTQINGATQYRNDFFFFISCEGSCEASDVDLWVRMRMSERNWEEGKKDWASDIEYWCEGQTATFAEDPKGNKHNEFTFPHELLPDEPTDYPFRITHSMPDSASAISTLIACLAGLIAAIWVL